MYLVSCTRPDIAAAVNQLSQAMSHPLKEHMTAAKHVLKYLQATTSSALQYKKCSDNNLVGFTDASFGSTESRRSVTGYVFLLNGAAISWKTRVQPTVALSTAESEYMAACAAVPHKRQYFSETYYPTLVSHKQQLYSSRTTNRQSRLLKIASHLNVQNT